jgi:hypothetical protein
MFDIMMDIETLSTDSTRAAVMSIGAVKFTRGQLREDWSIDPNVFYCALDLTGQLMNGRTVTRKTQAWWMEQSKDAKDAILDAMPIGVQSALYQLGTFCTAAREIWANGVVFDLGNLEDLHFMSQQKVPWQYNAVRDARTIYRLFPARRDRPKFEDQKAPIVSHVKHDAVADCIEQVWKLYEHWPDGVET